MSEYKAQRLGRDTLYLCHNLLDGLDQGCRLFQQLGGDSAAAVGEYKAQHLGRDTLYLCPNHYTARQFLGVLQKHLGCDNTYARQQEYSLTRVET